MNKKQLYTGLGIFSIIGIIGMGVTTQAGFLGSTSATEALREGNLEAFKAAVAADGGERISKRLDSLDEERFTQLQEKLVLKDAITEAIENEDYEAYQQAISELEESDNSSRRGRRRAKRNNKLIATTEEEFMLLVERYNELQDTQAALTQAVQNDDRATFDAIVEESLQNMSDRASENSFLRDMGREFELSQEELDTLWETAQEAVANGEELNLRTIRKAMKQLYM